jgi:hypothetical protein
MTTAVTDIMAAFESLMTTYVSDLKAMGTLQLIKDNLSRCLDPLPDGLKLDLCQLLKLLLETKSGSGELWQQICTLKDDVQNLQHKITAFNAAAVASQIMANTAATAAMAATTAAIVAIASADASAARVTAAAEEAIASADASAARVTAAAEEAIASAARVTAAAEEAIASAKASAAKAIAAAEEDIASAAVSAAELQASKERLTIRQVYHALNEKLLRRVIVMSGMTDKDFWNLDISNISKVEKHGHLRKAWCRVQKDCGIKLSAKELWDGIVEGKHEFDTFVHKGSFEVVGYKKLLEIAERVFVGEHEKLKPGFLKLAALSKSLSEKLGKNLFEY